MAAQWTAQEKRYLEKVYADKSNAEIAREMGKDVQAVRWQAWKLSLLKSNQHRLQELKRAGHIRHAKNERAIHSGFVQQQGNITIHRMA